MVHIAARDDEEEDQQRIDHEHSLAKSEDVQFSRMEGSEDRLQTVRRMSRRSLFIVESFSYASLYFCCAIEQDDNELLTLEVIHRYVELLDKYFSSVRSRRSERQKCQSVSIFRCVNWTSFSTLKKRILSSTNSSWGRSARDQQEERSQIRQRSRCHPRGQQRERQKERDLTVCLFRRNWKRDAVFSKISA